MPGQDRDQERRTEGEILEEAAKPPKAPILRPDPMPPTPPAAAAPVKAPVERPRKEGNE